MVTITKQQVLAWTVVAVVILLIGGNYIRGHVFKEEGAAMIVETVELKEGGSGSIKVHVAGAVLRPGLYELEPDKRVADALEMAGGPLAEADLTQVNLAAKLADGRQIIVPVIGAQPVQAGAAGSGSSKVLVNINTATADELTALNGVGEKTAEKIIEYREAKGSFQTAEELMDVPGIGPAKFEEMKDQVTL